ncbi:MAG: methyltransferase domain-containing protein, partial [Candidatus Omnitrophica bacterium]|nr:methyltransferase domain-containing protein [Candidatus Omnitrophota bacterium]
MIKSIYSKSAGNGRTGLFYWLRGAGRRGVVSLVLAAFVLTGTGMPLPAYGQQAGSLPAPGALLGLSPSFAPALLMGIKVCLHDPFRFDFILDKGDVKASQVSTLSTTNDALRLIKYFLASLTIPEKDLWVNLSPYEKDRIVPDAFGQTEMGRDLLAQDYVLKQLTASVLYPEGETGKKFWAKVYQAAYEKFGTTDIPVDTFNKVWIMPAKAVVYENATADTAYVVESRLKVMLETDYLVTTNNATPTGGHVTPLADQLERGSVSPSRLPTSQPLNTRAPQVSTSTTTTQSPDVSQNIAKDVMRSIVIPILEKEVNEGANFAPLRQVYQSLILATWYKKKIKASLLSQVYVDKNKILGTEYTQSVIETPMPTGGHVTPPVDQGEQGAVSPSQWPTLQPTNTKAPQGNSLLPNQSRDPELIWRRYVEAFKKGVYNYVKEEQDPLTQEMIPRKYFSGGMDMAATVAPVMIVIHSLDRAGLTTPANRFMALTVRARLVDASEKVELRKRIQAEIHAVLNDPFWVNGGRELALSFKGWGGDTVLTLGRFPFGLVIADFKNGDRSVGVGLDLQDLLLTRMEKNNGLLTMLVFKGVNMDGTSESAEWIRNDAGVWVKNDIYRKTLDQIKVITENPAWKVTNPGISLGPMMGKRALDRGCFSAVLSIADFRPGNVRVGVGEDLDDIILAAMEREDGVIRRLVFMGKGRDGTTSTAAWLRNSGGVWEREKTQEEIEREQLKEESLARLAAIMADPVWQVKEPEFSMKHIFGEASLLRGDFPKILAIDDFKPGSVPVGLGEDLLDLVLVRLERQSGILSRLVFKALRKSGAEPQVVWRRSVDGVWARERSAEELRQDEMKAGIAAWIVETMADSQWVVKEPNLSLKEYMGKSAMKTGIFPKGLVFGDFKPGHVPSGVGGDLDDFILSRLERTNGILTRLEFRGIRKDIMTEPSVWYRVREGVWENKSNMSRVWDHIKTILIDPGWQVKEPGMSLKEVIGEKSLHRGLFSKSFIIDDFHPGAVAVGVGAMKDLFLARMERTDGKLTRLDFKGIKLDGTEVLVVWNRTVEGIWTKETSCSVVLDQIREMLADQSWFVKEIGLSLKDVVGEKLLATGQIAQSLVIGDFNPGIVSIGIGRMKDLFLARMERFDGILSRLVFRGIRLDGSVREVSWVRMGPDQWVKEDSEVKVKETRARAAVDREISDIFRGVWDRELWSVMASRYSLDMRNILWRLAAAHMDGAYDEDQLKQIVDDRITDLITSTGDESAPVLAPVADEKNGNDVSVVHDPDKVRLLAGNLQKCIDKVTAGRQRDEAFLAIVRRQATDFIRKLEEKYFFKKYYAPQGEEDPVVRTMAAVEAARDREPAGILRDALSLILTSLEAQVLPLQYTLKEQGLRQSTHLNLYQLVNVDRILKSHQALEADEMGTGKTLVALASFLASGEQEMLVLGPGQVLNRWVEDLADHTDTPIDLVVLNEGLPLDKLARHPLITVQRLSGMARYDYLNGVRSAPAPGRRRVILFNYEGVSVYSRHQQAPIRTDFLVLDEAHFLKRASTRRSQAVFGDSDGKGAAEAKYKLVMTGTPLENDVADLFGYLQFLARGGNTPEELWLCSLDARQFASVFRKTDLGKMSLLHSYLATHMIRWLKDEVLGGLPAKSRHRVELDPYNKTMEIDGKVLPLEGDFETQMALYDEVLRHPGEFEENYGSHLDREPDGEEREQASNESALMLMRLEQVLASPAIFGQEGDSVKFAAAAAIIKDRLAKSGSTLVFSGYRTVTERFMEYLRKAMPEVALGYSDGDIKIEARATAVDDFQNKRIPVLVSTIGTLGVGQNLTQADAVIFLDKPWKPSTYDQAVDRTHRWDALRNFLGRVIDIYDLDVDIPVSIDAVKGRVLRVKRLLSEMIVNGHLSPQIMDTFRNLQQDAIDSLNAEVDPDDVKFDEYESGLISRFLVRLGQILHTPENARATGMWDELAGMYAGILEHKGSFYANQANLDHLSQAFFTELKSTPEAPKKALDLGSGPSTMLRAYLHRKEALNARGLYLKVTDFDLSPKMLAHGIPRPGEQIAGPFEDISKIPAESFDLVNMSYAFRYVKDSNRVEFFRNVHRILKPDGLFSVILPMKNQVSQRFIDGLRSLGFEPQTGEGARLESHLEEATYQALVKEHGEEFANDIRDEVKAQFTYLVVKKAGGAEAVEVSNDEFNIHRDVRPMDEEKIKRLQLPVPDEADNEARPAVAVSGFLTYDEGHMVLAQDKHRKSPARKFKNRLAGLRQVITQLQVEQSDRNNRKKIERHTTSIKNRIKAFEDSYEALTEDQKEVIAGEMEADVAALEKDAPVWEWLQQNGGVFARQLGVISADAAQILLPGGIDLNPQTMGLDVKTDGKGIDYHLDPAMIQRFQSAAGFSPDIVDIRPLASVAAFLGISLP